jgi:transposase-like protein
VARHRRRVTPQSKAEAVQFVIETHRPIAVIVVERARVAETQDEIRRLQSVNEILGNAAAALTTVTGIICPEPHHGLLPVESAPSIAGRGLAEGCPSCRRRTHLS